jgi:hypothetical protein
VKKVSLTSYVNGKLEVVGEAELDDSKTNYRVIAHVYPGSVLARRLAEVGTADFSFDLKGETVE